MNRLSLWVGVCAGVLGLAVMPGAHAEEVPTKLLGDAASAAQASRTIVIGPDTRYVNVKQGEVVRFVAGTQEFAFNFDGANVSSFDLRRVAPDGVLDHGVTAYVAPAPDGGGRSHRGSGGRR